MLFSPIFALFMANWLATGAASCIVGNACNEIDEGASFLQRVAVGSVATDKILLENITAEMAIGEEAVGGGGSGRVGSAAIENAGVERAAAEKATVQNAATGACCKIVNDYGLGTHVIWLSLRLPIAQRTWWRQNDCNKLVGGTGASRCKGPAPVEQVNAVKAPAAIAEVEKSATDKTIIREAATAARVTATVSNPVEVQLATISSGMDPSATMCIRALKQSVNNVIGTLLEQAPTPILLWDPAMHANIGDQLITLAEDTLRQPFRSSVCCIVSCSAHDETRCPETPDDAAKRGFGTYLLHGGGNWGDIYPSPQDVRIKLLENLASCCPKTVIIGMPQNLEYRSSGKAQIEAARIELAVQKFTTPPVFLWRDQESLANASKLYPSATNVLSPEVAWALYPLSQPSERTEFEYDVLVSARFEESVEGYSQNFMLFNSTVHRADAEKPVKVLYSRGWEDFTAHDPEGNHSWRGYDESLLSYRFQGAVSWIRSAPIVVTDKLHMTILAMLSGAQVIFVDNSYQKLQRTMDASFALAGPPCANMRAALSGNPTQEIPGIVQAADFASAAEVILRDEVVLRDAMLAWDN